jgi:hypothetical protein
MAPLNKLRVIHGDLGLREDVERGFAKHPVDTVIHFAAIAYVGKTRFHSTPPRQSGCHTLYYATWFCQVPNKARYHSTPPRPSVRLFYPITPPGII